MSQLELWVSSCGQCKRICEYGANEIAKSQLTGSSLFDNIYIGHSIEDATRIKTETFDVKSTVEKAEKEAQKKKEEAEKPKIPSDLTFTEDPVNFVKEKINLFVSLVQNDPVEAVKTVPEVAGGAGVLLVTVLALLLGGIGAGAKNPKVQEKAKQATDKAAEAKDKAVGAASSGIDRTKEEVNKRTTRSSATADQ